MRRAFTLVELMVVIVIMGVLASMVLVTGNAARAKSRDAQVKSDMSQLKNLLSIYYADNRTYMGATNDSRVQALNTDLIAVANQKKSWAFRFGLSVTATTYEMYAYLNATTTVWCMNSAGVAKEMPTNTACLSLI